MRGGLVAIRSRNLPLTRGRSAFVPIESLDTPSQYSCSCAHVMCFMPSLLVCMTWHSAQFNFSLFTCCSLRLKSELPFSIIGLSHWASLEEPSRGAHAGVRVGGAQNPGPVPHERVQKHAALAEHASAKHETQYLAARTRSREEFRTCSCQILQQRRPLVETQPNSRRPTPPRSRQRDYLRCAQCGSDPEVCTRNSDYGLMLRMFQKHLI